MKNYRTLLVTFVGFACIAAPGAYADALHSCYGTPTPLTCGDTGVMNPVNSNTPTFTFTDSGGPATSDFWVVALIPNNEDPLPVASLTLNVKNGGASNNSNFSDPANLFSSTAWTSGALDTYLGISASPNNPIGNYLNCAQNTSNCGTGGPYVSDPNATGFYVYVADLGTNTLAANGSQTGNPMMQFSTALPQDSFVVAFLDPPATWTATANSGSLFINSTVPEPSQIWLLLLGAIALGLIYRSKHRRAA